MNELYETQVTATGDGRSGAAISDDGRLRVDLSPPPELGGDPSRTGTNPEQLFAAGYAACFHSALRAIGRRHRQDVTGSAVAARVILQRDDGGEYGLAVELVVDLPTVPSEVAGEIVDEADRVCPYSRAIRGNVIVRCTINSSVADRRRGRTEAVL